MQIAQAIWLRGIEASETIARGMQKNAVAWTSGMTAAARMSVTLPLTFWGKLSEATAEDAVPGTVVPKPRAKSAGRKAKAKAPARPTGLKATKATATPKARPVEPVTAKAPDVAAEASTPPAAVKPAEVTARQPQPAPAPARAVPSGSTEDAAAPGPAPAAAPTAAAQSRARGAVPDDLKRIIGLGPKLEKQLNAEGITTFAQVASLTGPEIEALDAKIQGLAKRAESGDWTMQAKMLAEG